MDRNQSLQLSSSKQRIVVSQNPIQHLKFIRQTTHEIQSFDTNVISGRKFYLSEENTSKARWQSQVYLADWISNRVANDHQKPNEPHKISTHREPVSSAYCLRDDLKS